ncbi:hypothetical protein BGW36DRAFT_394152 [Talaromyces proteolyticus]|uniref:Acyltransferase 3 domain-containing protein n=1 Tax=Talaromyces proteolyticus TaxID=1131652 RepID=A0AAD4L1L9_9EURO|nr:uncharacterized protein BGW36DRAFT_394152 [Talaromyces proteolyticus]KAH8703966.1 hypothetical protein BGW36DRAFT_394152 [Talaromyces proteolyticus]
MGGFDLTALQKRVMQAPPTQYEQLYLVGFRGVLVISTFLWVFLQTFAPTTVYAAWANQDGPHDQENVRKVLSVLFWNQYFLIGSIIFLSARSIAIPFFRNPTKESIARILLTRPLTLCIPAAIAVAIVKGSITDDFVNNILLRFAEGTNNNAIPIPQPLPTTLSYWNSVFNLFWVSHQFAAQAANYAYPTQTLWMITAVYIQSYTVYMTMIVVPYTRPKWRVQFSIFFIIAAWWCQSWAWYTISGLIMADMVVNMDFKVHAQRGIPVQFRNLAWRQADGRPRRIPVWSVAGLVMLGGIAMQYVWVAARPDLFTAEWEIHSNPYSIGGLNTEYQNDHTSARDDVYLMLVGFFFLLETYDILQRVLQNRFFVYLGSRSYSYFLIQPILIYRVGIRVFGQLRGTHGIGYPGSVVVTLITCLAVTVPAAELYHRLVCVPSRYLAHHFYEFITS